MGLTSPVATTREAAISSPPEHVSLPATLWRGQKKLGFLLAILAIVLPRTAAAQASVPTVKLSPETIQMGAFYSGAKIRIEGTAPAGSQVLVVIRGDEADEFFNKKGRVGPIWVNTDKIHIAGAPSLFLSFSSADVNSLLDRASVETYQLDESAIKNRLACRSHCKHGATSGHGTTPGTLAECKGVEPDPQYRELIRSSYLALQTRQGRYQTHPGAVRMVNATAGDSRYSVDLDWPRSAPPDSYRVEVYACKNRSVIGRTTAPLRVVEVGFPEQMATLSGGHPTVYGLIAVLAAILAGFTIDALTVRLRRRSWGNPRPKARGHADLPEPTNPAEAADHEPEPEPAHHT
jgi:putative transmembrane protein Alph_Pro_TM